LFYGEYVLFAKPNVNLRDKKNKNKAQTVVYCTVFRTKIKIITLKRTSCGYTIQP